VVCVGSLGIRIGGNVRSLANMKAQWSESKGCIKGELGMLTPWT